MKKILKKILIYILGFGLLILITKHLPFMLISGNSMYPTYEDGQFVSLSFNTDKLSRDEIIIFNRKTKYPIKQKLIKRLCGLPGDKIYQDKNGIYFIYDGENIFYYDGINQTSDTSLLEESDYLYTIPTSEYFFMGDNRDESVDSREFGTIKRTQIIAKVKE